MNLTIEWFRSLQDELPQGSVLYWLAIAVFSSILSIILKSMLVLISKRLRRIAEMTASIWDDVFVDILDSLNPIVIFIWIFSLLTKALSPQAPLSKVINISVVVISIFQIALWGHHLIRNWRKSFLDKKIQQDPSSAAALGLLYTTVQVLFLIIVVLIGISNLGVDIGALLAGLGVGGIAVALAAQNVLGDILASLSIVLDKPFLIGDFIVAGNDKGTVEHIGIKTTRLRSISGEELVLSNKDLLESRIQNFKRMQMRRVVQKLGVTYSTTAETIEKIPVWIREIVQKYDLLQFDRCHFSGYGASSLDFELVFFVLDSDYNIYMDYQQKVLIDIFRRFAEAKVIFAFPSQSIYIEKNN